jgi:hypothetical protein
MFFKPSPVVLALAVASIAVFLILPVHAQKTVNDKVLLAENGQPKAIIVLPDSSRDEAAQPNERMNLLAAQQLQEFLKRMSGAEFKIARLAEMDDVQVNGASISSVKVPATSYIVVGESELTKKLGITPELKPGAMYVKAAGNTLVLMGPTDGTPYTGGTLYAAHHVLESLGMKYLWPGESGLAIPKLKDIAVPYGTQMFTPIIQQRNMRMVLGGARTNEGAKDLGIEEDYQKKLIENAKLKATFATRSVGGWNEWHNMGGSRGISGGHSFGDLYERFGKNHPGWFALQPNGSRTQHSSERARLCVSNSQLIQQIAADIIAKADANPNMQSTPLSPNDGGTDTFCMCKVNELGEPGCATYDPPEGRKIDNLYGWNMPYVSLTDRYMVFSNRVAEIVAKKYPNLLLVVDAYSAYSAPPVKTKLNPNLVVRYVPSTMEDWDAWSQKASKLYWRPNTLSSPYRIAELKFNSEYGKDLNYAAHHSTIATDFDSIINNWATEGLNYYIVAKMNWNPDANVQQLMDEYCRDGFGPAADEIKRYFKIAEQITDVREPEMFRRYNNGNPIGVTVHVRPDTLIEYYTPEKMAQLRALLDAATQKTSGAQNEDFRKRVDFLRIGLDWTDIQIRAHKVLNAFKKDQPVDLVAAEKLLRERRAMMLKIFNENPMAINVAYLNWGDRGYWQPLNQAIAKAGIKPPAGTEGKTMIDADENGQPIVVPKTN